MQMYRAHRRNLPERTDAHRVQITAGGTQPDLPSDRINHPPRNHRRTYEDRYACPHRRTQRTL